MSLWISLSHLLTLNPDSLSPGDETECVTSQGKHLWWLMWSIFYGSLASNLGWGHAKLLQEGYISDISPAFGLYSTLILQVAWIEVVTNQPILIQIFCQDVLPIGDGHIFITRRERVWVEWSSKCDRDIHRLMDKPSCHRLAFEEAQCNGVI